MSGRKAVPASGTAGGELPLPLTGILVDPVNERQVSRVWRNIAARRAVSGGQVGLALRWGFVGALLGTLVTLIIVTASSSGPVAVEAAATVGPLKLADGRPLEAIEVVATSHAASTPLSDGSVIRVEPEARIEPLVSSETQLVLRLARGRAHFNVRPGGGRRWLVEAGLATIEVVGTEFTVDRSSERVRVEVAHGLVLVRGNTLPDGVVRLGAGQSVDVRAAPPPEVRPEERQPATQKSARSRGAAPAPRWREALTGGGYRDAYAVLGAEGLAQEARRSESADDLFDLADVARLSGHPAEAVIPLERLLSLHPGSPRAPVAALTLGRIRLELKNPRAAAASLEQALRLGVPQGLEEDAFVRLVQAHAESGNRAEANRVFDVYTRRYPNGRRSAEARSWLLR